MPREISEQDAEVIRQCLRAAVEGPFFHERVFETLFGLSRSEVREVLARWPTMLDSEETDAAVVNTLNNLLGYPHKRFDVWSSHVSVQPSEVAQVLRRWLGQATLDATGKGYFNRMR